MLPALVVAVLVAVTAIAWRSPWDRRTTREVEPRNSAQVVWAAVSDFSAVRAWAPGIRRVQKLDAVEGAERWLYETAEGDMTIDVVAQPAPAEPAEPAIRTVNSHLAFGGI